VAAPAYAAEPRGGNSGGQQQGPGLIDNEAGEAFWALFELFYCGHPRRRRAFPAPLDELADGIGLSFGYHLDPAVGEVARPSGHAEAVSHLGAGTAVPNALYPAADP